MARYKREGDDEYTGDDAELDHPIVAQWVEQRADEQDRQHEMGEGEPIVPVSKEGIVLVGVKHTRIDSLQPGVYVRIGWKAAGEESQLSLGRHGREPAHEQGDDEENDP